jgi:ribonuclease BN (tRNA processing enzyme)
VKLRVVGSSPAWPNPGGAQSGYLVDDRLLLDCGPGVLAKLRADDGWPRIDAIVITHWHLDHWGDIVPWVWGRMFGLGRELASPELWVPPGGLDELHLIENRLGIPGMWERTFVPREYEEGQSFQAAGLTVTPLRLPHYTLVTFGLRVTDGERTIAYSGDTGPSDKLAELAHGVDLFLCEATLLRGDLDGQPRGHLSEDEALAAFRASGAKRLLITHRPQELALGDGVEQAYDGLELSV